MFESGASHSKLELRRRTSVLEMLLEPDVGVMFTRQFRGIAERFAPANPTGTIHCSMPATFA